MFGELDEFDKLGEGVQIESHPRASLVSASLLLKGHICIGVCVWVRGAVVPVFSAERAGHFSRATPDGGHVYRVMTKLRGNFYPVLRTAGCWTSGVESGSPSLRVIRQGFTGDTASNTLPQS